MDKTPRPNDEPQWRAVLRATEPDADGFHRNISDVLDSYSESMRSNPVINIEEACRFLDTITSMFADNVDNLHDNVMELEGAGRQDSTESSLVDEESDSHDRLEDESETEDDGDKAESPEDDEEAKETRDKNVEQDKA